MTPIQVLRRGAARRVELVPMTPIEQLRAGRLVHRVSQLLVGLVLFGISMALLLRADLGLEPWGVLQYGLIQHIPMSYGAMSIVVSFVVLLLWIPLRQWPGLGTVLNAVVIGVAIDATLAVVPDDRGARLAGRWSCSLAIVGNGVAGAMYIGSQLGPGPRDGLMTGLARRTGRSIRLVRTSLEVTVVVLGFAARRHRRGRAPCSTRCSSARSCSSSCRGSPCASSARHHAGRAGDAAAARHRPRRGCGLSRRRRARRAGRPRRRPGVGPGPRR